MFPLYVYYENSLEISNSKNSVVRRQEQYRNNSNLYFNTKFIL